MTCAAGEAALSDWMAANAFVAWTTCPAPWELERQLIRELRVYHYVSPAGISYVF
jgi:hypothetical protein